MSLLVQRFLQDGGTILQLQEKYGIKARRHLAHENMVLLKYHMTLSPMAEPIVQECRGLILDEARDWYVVSRPFDKFFNVEEGHAAPIDWSTARVQEKLDGSLMVLYYYNGKWEVSSSGLPDAAGEINGLGITFNELFWQTFNSQYLILPQDSDYCYIFELTAPHNRVVVQYMEPKLTLIGVRHRSGHELPVSTFMDRYPVVRSYDVSDLQGVRDTFEGMDPLKQEGYVVVDKDFHRVKIKNPRYLAIHHAIDGMGPKRALEIVRNGEGDEVLAYFPEWKGKIDDIRSKYEALIDELQTEYVRIKDITIQKEFATEAVKSNVSGALFCVRNGKCGSIRDYMSHFISLDKLADQLDLGDGTFQSPS